MENKEVRETVLTDNTATTLETFHYDNQIVRMFVAATLLWAAVGMLAGLWIALELAFPHLNFGLPYITFGRLRPIHTNGVIFAFIGNGIFAGVYHSIQRLSKARMYSDLLGRIHFWGWQLIIVSAALTLAFGFTTGKEYAELEWPIDVAIAVIWIIFGINMIGTLIKRREKHLYVAIWFYISTWITVAVLHVVNSFELPVSFLKSYSWYAGVQDALVQWWYGHNAVAFFLTTPFLGLMYYYVPKAAQRPVYSYRLSIIHFWALIFIYIWAGPHHLLYTALPDWAQSLGMVFSIMLIAPSWGGAINGLLTLRGAWDKVRQDPVLKFFVVAITAYAMATFEGPMHAIKSINAFTHYTNWIPAHVHIGALGWNGFLLFGMLYWLVPKMWNVELKSVKLANIHFWIGTLGIIFWTVPMYWAGTVEGLEWKAFDASGLLKYDFIDVVKDIKIMYITRAIGGALYLTGFFIMLYNLLATMAKGAFVKEEKSEAVPYKLQPDAEGKLTGYLRHRIIERKPVLFTVLAAVAILIGTIAEFVPGFLIKSNVPTIAAVKPYTPLELEGRDIYLSEGCYNCHSQMIRPFRSETERYGEYSKAGEFVYDHPFQWGSKRTGPDLHRVGGKYSDAWHYQHMQDPETITEGTLMPRYPWLYKNDLDYSNIGTKISAMRTLGVPYPEGYEKKAADDLLKQANEIKDNLAEVGIKTDANKEIIALIAYLQRLGTDIKAENTETSSK